MFNFATYNSFLEDYRTAESEERRLKRGRKPVPDALLRKITLELPEHYRAKLPVYEMAVCPLCGAIVKEAIDTFSLAGIGWRNDGPNGFGWHGRFRADHRRPHYVLQEDGWPQPSYQASCDHVQGMTYGVNLNGIYPTDSSGFVEIGEEQPGVLRPFIEQEGCTAVLRTLPVGRCDDDVWQPRYTAWFLTYFSPTPDPFRTPLLKANEQNPSMEHDTFYWPYRLLTHDLMPLITTGKMVDMPENEVAWDKLQGLNGRWAKSLGRLRLIPEKTWNKHQISLRAQKGFWETKEAEKVLLAARNLAIAPIFLERFATRLTQFITETAVWQSELPFTTSDTFIHPLHGGIEWSLSLQAEGEKVRLNFHMKRPFGKNRITRPLFLGTAVELENTLTQIAEKIEALAEPQGQRIMFQTLIDYAPST